MIAKKCGEILPLGRFDIDLENVVETVLVDVRFCHLGLSQMGLVSVERDLRNLADSFQLKSSEV